MKLCAAWCIFVERYFSSPTPMSTLILAESGSTKTDWRIIKNDKVIYNAKTSGVNPYLQKDVDIEKILNKEFPAECGMTARRSVVFYGAGVSKPQNNARLSAVLQKFFGTSSVSVMTDMLGAARALCGNKKGVVCILGTGSNSCYYDGQDITDQQASLGYLAGDEGSGNHLGKKVLQYYAYKTFDEELMASFEQEWGTDLGSILTQLYSHPFPNRYLASFVKLLTGNRGHFMVENIVEDAFTTFFNKHIFKYRQTWKGPVHFAGSVAYEFRDVIAEMCHQYEIELGQIVQAPMDALVHYHTSRTAVL